MRKLGDALLIMPALALLALSSLGGHVRRRPLIGVIAVIAIGTLSLAALTRPVPGAATQPTVLRPVSGELLEKVRTGHGLRAPFTLSFDAPMDAASVAGALRISPDAAVTFSWDSTGKTLTITPVDAWAEGTLYTITVGTSAVGTDGSKLAAPVRAVVLTAGHAGGTIAATKLAAGKARLDTTFAISLDHPVTLAALNAALKITPTVAGSVAAGDEAGSFVFTPDDLLAPGTEYTLTLTGLHDVNGLPFDPAPEFTITTAASPEIVRFRPKDGTTGVDRLAQLSVRFTASMDRTSTVAALSVTANGTPVKGKVSWAEKDTVLIFTPSAAYAYKASVVMAVAETAHSKAGAPLDSAGAIKIVIAAKPPPKPTIAPVRTPTPISHSGGSGAVAGTWAAVENYYLKLMNCTRTGGWVTDSGACSSPGGRNVAPLVINPTISAKVTRPYAKYLAVHGACNHYYDGSPGNRLARAGFTSYKWGENIGCGNGNPFKAVIADHLFFQSERPYNGGHYRNLMDAGYNMVGIGVWVSGSTVRLVIDFYHP